MNSPFGTRHVWPKLLHLARLVPRGGPVLPFILIPALVNAAVVILFDSRQHFFHFCEYKANSFLLIHGAYPSGLCSIHIILQNSPRTWLAETDFPDSADRKISVD